MRYHTEGEEIFSVVFSFPPVDKSRQKKCFTSSYEFVINAQGTSTCQRVKRIAYFGLNYSSLFVLLRMHRAICIACMLS